MECSPDAVPARARALGILPGYQYVFVVDQLLASLSTAAGRAVIAHEIGHHRGWHPLVRVGLPAVALIVWSLAIASGVSYPLASGAVVLPLYVLLVCYIERETEYRADEYVARKVGDDSMIHALEYLEKTDSDQQRSRGARLLATRPSFAQRIAHLEDFAGKESNEENNKKTNDESR